MRLLVELLQARDALMSEILASTFTKSQEFSLQNLFRNQNGQNKHFEKVDIPPKRS